MIRSFRHRGLKRLYERGDGSRLPPEHLTRIRLIMGVLDAADRIEGIDVFPLRLHSLKGELTGFWSVTVRANWLITFRFDDGHVWDVDFVDYH